MNFSIKKISLLILSAVLLLNNSPSYSLTLTTHPEAELKKLESYITLLDEIANGKNTNDTVQTVYKAIKKK